MTVGHRRTQGDELFAYKCKKFIAHLGTFSFFPTQVSTTEITYPLNHYPITLFSRKQAYKWIYVVDPLFIFIKGLAFKAMVLQFKFKTYYKMTNQE